MWRYIIETDNLSDIENFCKEKEIEYNQFVNLLLWLYDEWLIEFE